MPSSRDDLPSARLDLLLQASEVLGQSLDYAETLASLASLLVPRLADGYAVDLVGAQGDIRRVAAVSGDPQKADLARRLMHLGALNSKAPEGIQRLLEAGVARLTELVTDDGLCAGARDEDHLAILRGLEIHSMIIVPLRARGRAIGLLWLYYSKTSMRVYRPADLAFVEEIAARAALAIENARLWREAQEAISARDAFLSMASHELRTPLTSMLLRVQGELRRLHKHPEVVPAREEIEAWLTSLNTQAGRLARLVDEMLDVSRMASGALQLVREKVDLGKIVRDVTRVAAEEAKKKGSELEVDTSEEIVGWWDAARTAQMVTALVSNAIKYGGGKPIFVQVKREGDRAVLLVCDHGIGIEQAHLGRIFERFERQVSARNYGGFGLGLWIARQLVEASGGTISVESESGRGATFRVELPLEAAIDDAPEPRATGSRPTA